MSRDNPSLINCVRGDEYVVPYWPPNSGAYESDGALEFL
jgi:hypothetical protein